MTPVLSIRNPAAALGDAADEFLGKICKAMSGGDDGDADGGGDGDDGGGDDSA